MRYRPSGALLISIAVHIVVGVALAYVLAIPNPVRNIFQREDDDLPVERISFLAIPDRGVTSPGRRGGDDRPAAPTRRRRSTPPARTTTPPAPVETPRELPSPDSLPTPPVGEAGAEGGTGPLVGGGGAAPGLTPSYADPRVWVAPGPVVSAPKTPEQRLDSAVTARLEAHRDSLAALTPARRRPGDWTFEKNGKKYGIDQKKIYLGDITIPTAVLALLPLNVQGNPTTLERERTLNAMHREISEQAQRAMNEEEFREAVKRIRERKERERQRAAEQKEVATP